MPVTWGRRSTDLPHADPYRSMTHVDASPCYDFLISLLALYNPRLFENTRAWAATTRPRLPAELYERGRFFFQGQDTGLGYGAARLIADLPTDAGPADLIQAIRECDPRTLALYLLDTGDLATQRMPAFRRLLDGPLDVPALTRALRGFTPEWAERCRTIITEPEQVRSDLARVLEEYLAAVFMDELPQLLEPLRRAAANAQELLEVLPTAEAIEHLTGGYTFAEDLSLTRITLAPSLFMYPFMSSRVDDVTGDALIVYGVRTDAFLKYETAPVDPHLLQALKALSDPGRLRLLHLIGKRPMFGPELVKALGLTQPTVHHHIAQLRAAGLVRQERTNSGMRYTGRRDTAATVLKALERLLVGAE